MAIYGTGFFVDTSLNIYNSNGSLFKQLYNIGTNYTDNTFIVSYDLSGNGIWATRIGGIYGDAGYDICTDNNYIYMCGQMFDLSLNLYNSDGTFFKYLNNVKY